MTTYSQIDSDASHQLCATDNNITLIKVLRLFNFAKKHNNLLEKCPEGCLCAIVGKGAWS